MNMAGRVIASATTAILLAVAPAIAGNTLVKQGVAVSVARSALTVMPDREWNRMGARPGRRSETWTLDGATLNDLTFYGAIETGKTLFREVDRKHRPLPRYSSRMLLTDIPMLLEDSYRIALGTSLMTIDTVQPTLLAGSKAVRFTYTCTRPGEDVERRGEAVAAIIGRKLFMMSYEAPAIFYFDRDLAAFRRLVATAWLAEGTR
jgi:hypothetical protein